MAENAPMTHYPPNTNPLCGPNWRQAIMDMLYGDGHAETIFPSDEELRAIQARCSKATDGPWLVGWRNDFGSSLGGTVCVMDEDECVTVGRVGDFGPTNDPRADAEFIAHARRDVPMLLAEVVRLRRLVASTTQP